MYFLILIKKEYVFFFSFIPISRLRPLLFDSNFRSSKAFKYKIIYKLFFLCTHYYSETSENDFDWIRKVRQNEIEIF